MAANRSGLPTPPSDPQDSDHRMCPVCGWRPCTASCRVGMDAAALELVKTILSQAPPGGCEAED